jgi:hypothetical protein
MDDHVKVQKWLDEARFSPIIYQYRRHVANVEPEYPLTLEYCKDPNPLPSIQRAQSDPTIENIETTPKTPQVKKSKSDRAICRNKYQTRDRRKKRTTAGKITRSLLLFWHRVRSSILNLTLGSYTFNTPAS